MQVGHPDIPDRCIRYFSDCTDSYSPFSLTPQFTLHRFRGKRKFALALLARVGRTTAASSCNRQSSPTLDLSPHVFLSHSTVDVLIVYCCTCAALWPTFLNRESAPAAAAALGGSSTTLCPGSHSLTPCRSSVTVLVSARLGHRHELLSMSGKSGVTPPLAIRCLYPWTQRQGRTPSTAAPSPSCRVASGRDALVDG